MTLPCQPRATEASVGVSFTGGTSIHIPDKCPMLLATWSQMTALVHRDTILKCWVSPQSTTACSSRGWEKKKPNKKSQTSAMHTGSVKCTINQRTLFLPGQKGNRDYNLSGLLAGVSYPLLNPAWSFSCNPWETAAHRPTTCGTDTAGSRVVPSTKVSPSSVRMGHTE